MTHPPRHKLGEAIFEIETLELERSNPFYSDLENPDLHFSESLLLRLGAMPVKKEDWLRCSYCDSPAQNQYQLELHRELRHPKEEKDFEEIEPFAGVDYGEVAIGSIVDILNLVIRNQNKLIEKIKKLNKED